MATGGEKLTSSEETCDLKCTSCNKRNRIKQATSYCRDCPKYLCVGCVETHNEYIEGHSLVDLHGLDQLYNWLTEKCETHRDQIVEQFCVDHDELTCTVCAKQKHRSCQVKHIIGSAEVLKKSPDLQEVTEQLHTALQHMDQAISALDKHTEELSQSESKYLQEIEDYTKGLLARIEDLKRNARKDVSTKHQQLASRTELNRQACIRCKTYINTWLGNTKIKNKRKAHLFLLKKQGQKTAQRVESLYIDTEQLIKNTRFVYQANRRVGQYLTDTTYLGRIEDKYQASLKATISAKVKDDPRSCVIMGCCLLPDGTVLLTDHSNNRVKRVDPSDCTIKDQFDHKGDPCGITLISPYAVAVSTGGSSLQVVSFRNKMTCTSTIQLNHNCSGIVQSNGELFTTCDDSVFVHDLTGKLLRTIEKTESGENMFSGIRGIALNETGDRVYVADWNMGLICTDRIGQEVFRCSGKDLGLSGAVGVCSAQGDNVLVGGYESHNVVQVTGDGRVIGQILSEADGIETPRCLCCDADRHILYVGGSMSKLLMYQLL